MCEKCKDTGTIIVHRGEHEIEVPCPECQPINRATLEKDTLLGIYDPVCEYCGSPVLVTRNGTRITTVCKHCGQR
jgi:hypothetical protein